MSSSSESHGSHDQNIALDAAIARDKASPQPSPSSADKISDERLAEIAAEYGSMADGLPPQLEDAPGAASAFYMSCSLGEVAAMATELATRRAQSAVVGDGYVMVPQAAIDWLDGAAPDADGKWFGDDVPEGKPYWWRSRFRAMIAALNPKAPS